MGDFNSQIGIREKKVTYLARTASVTETREEEG